MNGGDSCGARVWGWDPYNIVLCVIVTLGMQVCCPRRARDVHAHSHHTVYVHVCVLARVATS
jgi:hypothetical protein